MNKATALVLFDIDGTLMRGAAEHHRQALVDGIQRVTKVATHFEGVATAGALDRDLIVEMLRAGGYSERRARAALAEIVRECASCYTNNCAADLSRFVCSGVREFLKKVQERGAVLGIVSGNLSEIGWRKISLAGLRGHFSVAAFAEDGRTRARLARVCAGRAKHAGLVEKHCRVTLIGDHPNDVRAAKANGFRSVAVATGVTAFEKLEEARPDHLVRNLSELPVDAVV